MKVNLWIEIYSNIASYWTTLHTHGAQCGVHWIEVYRTVLIQVTSISIWPVTGMWEICILHHCNPYLTPDRFSVDVSLYSSIIWIWSHFFKNDCNWIRAGLQSSTIWSYCVVDQSVRSRFSRCVYMETSTITITMFSPVALKASNITYTWNTC